MENMNASTVVMLVKANGIEKVIKISLTTENGVIITFNDGNTVKIMDNSYWGAEAVDFANSRELFMGTSATTFSTNTAMSWAMIVTVLAHFEGVDTTSGST